MPQTQDLGYSYAARGALRVATASSRPRLPNAQNASSAVPAGRTQCVVAYFGQGT